MVVVVLVVIGFGIIPGILELQETNRVSDLFKEVELPISDDYMIDWTYYPEQFKDTDWYSWNVDIYYIDRPYDCTNIKLWLNIETMEINYEGELP